MTLWFIFGIMTVAALAAVSWPLARARASMSGASDVAVYRDQLEEIERDRADGRIGHDEFEAARVEVSRRLLGAAAAAGTNATKDADGQRRRVLALGCAVIAVPLIAIPLYEQLGSPGLASGQTVASRGVESDKQAPPIADLIARIEQHLKENPKDSRGWEVIAPVYMRLGRYRDAVTARRNLLDLLGSTAERETDLGEAMAMAAGGEITSDAKAAFERAGTIEPGNVKSMFYLGVAAQQRGDNSEAARLWRELIAQASPDAPWLPLVRERLAQVSPGDAPPAPGGYALATRPSAPAGPAAEAVLKMSPEEQAQFMRNRVADLEARLHKDGTDVDGWLRLLRAYVVLGERDKAKAAVAEARGALAREPEKLKLLDAGLKDLNVSE
jgi:cytochrome c-type biogenesis protein CcmH